MAMVAIDKAAMRKIDKSIADRIAMHLLKIEINRLFFSDVNFSDKFFKALCDEIGIEYSAQGVKFIMSRIDAIANSDALIDRDEVNWSEYK